MCHRPRARVRRRSQLLIGLSRDPRSSLTTWMLHLRAYQSHSSLMHQPDFSTCKNGQHDFSLKLFSTIHSHIFVTAFPSGSRTVLSSQ